MLERSWAIYIGTDALRAVRTNGLEGKIMTDDFNAPPEAGYGAKCPREYHKGSTNRLLGGKQPGCR